MKKVTEWKSDRKKECNRKVDVIRAKVFHLPRRVPDPTSLPQVAAVAHLFTGIRGGREHTEKRRIGRGGGQQQQLVIAHFECIAEQ